MLGAGLSPYRDTGTGVHVMICGCVSGGTDVDGPSTTARSAQSASDGASRSQKDQHGQHDQHEGILKS